MSNKFNPTDEQKKIIEPEAWRSSLVIAKAGSGKTTTIIHRAIKQTESLESWEGIAIISFTSKSSKDISDKIKYFNAKAIVSTTFHSFLLQHILVFSKIFKNKDVSFDFSKKVNSLLAWTKVVQEEKIIPVASNVSNDYLFKYAIFLLKEKPYILKYLKTRFVAIYIDEAQDNSHLQYEIVDILLSVGIQIVMIGDPNQTIYQFRGASADNFSELKKHDEFKNSIFELTHNFRCHKLINECAISYQVPISKIYVEEDGKYYGVFKTDKNLQEIKENFEQEQYYGEQVCFLFRSIRNNLSWLELNDIPIIQYPAVIQRQSTQSAISILDSLFEVYHGDSYLELSFIDKSLFNMRGKLATTLIRDFKNTPSVETFDALNSHWNIFKQEDYNSIINEMQLPSTKKFYNLSSNKFIAMTIHSAKGLEFENVVIQAQDFDNMQNNDNKKLFYVACTRAEKILIFM